MIKQKISIILPIRNEEQYIKKTLNSILDNNIFNDNIELIIIDGMSDDNTQYIVKDFINNNSNIKIYLYDNIHRTVPYAMNLGIKKSIGDIIIRLDAHSIYPKNYINSLIYWMGKLNADNVGGIVDTIPVDDKLESIAIAESVSSSFGVGNSQFRVLDSGRSIEVDTVPFGCYKKEVFEKIGLYDEELTRNQDDELNARLIKNGGKIFLVPQIKIKYYARDSYKKMTMMFYQYGYFKPLVNLKLGMPATIRQFIPLLFTLFLMFGTILSFVKSVYFILFLIGLIIYLFSNCIISYKISSNEKNIKLFPYLVKSFFLIHVSYGTGYIKGILDFLIFKKHRKKINTIRISR